MRCRCGPHRCITKVTAYWNTDGQERCLLQSSHSSLNHLNLSEELFGEEGSGLLVPCVVPQPRHNFTLTWTFIRTTESIVIFTYDSRTRRIVNLWEGKAELDIDQAHLATVPFICWTRTAWDTAVPTFAHSTASRWDIKSKLMSILQFVWLVRFTSSN